MSNKCRTTPKNTTCAPTVQPPAVAGCPPFDACLSFGRSLLFNGNCFSVQGTPNVTDGWYGEVQVVNGCIVDARPADIPVYTPAPCAPAAGPCGGESGGGGAVGCPPLSPDAKNLSYCTSGLLMTELVFGTLEGVTKSGAGTLNDPLNLSVNTGSGAQTYITNGAPNVLTLTGSGTLIDAYIIGMRNSALAAGTYGAITTDAYGRVIAYDAAADEGAIKSLIDGVGTTVTVGGGVGTVNIAATGVTAGSYVFGGHTATVNARGQLTGVQSDITIASATYRLGGYDVTLTSTGSVSAIVAAPPNTVGVPTTFVAQYDGDPTSGDTSRVMTVDLPVSGHLHVEYSGYLGDTTGAFPGMTLTATGLSITVDGVALPAPMVTTVDRYTEGSLARVGITATTAAPLAAGSHVVAVNGSAVVTQHDGLLMCDIVGLGV